MARIVLTYEIAHAAGTDAGNASMRRGGRTRWNEDDAQVAAETMNKLLDSMEDQCLGSHLSVTNHNFTR